MMMNIVAFLMTHFPDIETCPETNALGQILENQGFSEEDINHILFFIHVLNETQIPDFSSEYNEYNYSSMRIYTPDELMYLSTEIREFVHFLERERALSPAQRELIIHILMFLPEEDVTLEITKILTVLVWWAQQSQLPIWLGDDVFRSLYGNHNLKH